MFTLEFLKFFKNSWIYCREWLGCMYKNGKLPPVLFCNAGVVSCPKFIAGRKFVILYSNFLLILNCRMQTESIILWIWIHWKVMEILLRAYVSPLMHAVWQLVWFYFNPLFGFSFIVAAYHYGVIRRIFSFHEQNFFNICLVFKVQPCLVIHVYVMDKRFIYSSVHHLEFFIFLFFHLVFTCACTPPNEHGNDNIFTGDILLYNFPLTKLSKIIILNIHVCNISFFWPQLVVMVCCGCSNWMMWPIKALSMNLKSVTSYSCAHLFSLWFCFFDLDFCSGFWELLCLLVVIQQQLHLLVRQLM